MHSSYASVLLFVCAGLASSASPDTLPTIDLRLDPPQHPLPEVSSEIDRLDKSRMISEAEQQTALNTVFNTTLESASVQICSSIENFMRAILQGDMVNLRSSQAEHGDGASSFLSEPETKPAAQDVLLRVNVFRSPGPGALTQEKITAVERKRAAEEIDMFKQASLEMRELTNIVLHELMAELRHHSKSLKKKSGDVTPDMLATTEHTTATTFLKSLEHGSNHGGVLSNSVNLRVNSADVPFPSVVSSVKGMELRRDRSEKKARNRILELQSSLLQAENAKIEDCLRKSSYNSRLQKHQFQEDSSRIP